MFVEYFISRRKKTIDLLKKTKNAKNNQIQKNHRNNNKTISFSTTELDWNKKLSNQKSQSNLSKMPFISKDWRSPGEAWVKTDDGWEKLKVLECGKRKR